MEKKIKIIGNESIKRPDKTIKIPTTFTKIEDSTKKRRSKINSVPSKTSKSKRQSAKSKKLRENKLLSKMLAQKESTMFLVKKEALPQSLLKTAQIKESLARGDALTIQDALEEFELPRSTYEKYRNKIFSFYDDSESKIYTFLFEVEFQEDILARIVTAITKHKGSILLINQGFPLNGMAKIMISVDTSSLDMNLEVLIRRLKEISSVHEIEILGRMNSTAKKQK